MNTNYTSSQEKRSGEQKKNALCLSSLVVQWMHHDHHQHMFQKTVIPQQVSYAHITTQG